MIKASTVMESLIVGQIYTNQGQRKRSITYLNETNRLLSTFLSNSYPMSLQNRSTYLFNLLLSNFQAILIA